MTSVFSCQNSCSLLTCFVLYSKAKFACYVRYLLTSYFCIPFPYNEKGIFFGVLVLTGLVDLHRIIQLQLFSITGWGIDLDFHDIEWFALEMNRDHSVILFVCLFVFCIQVLQFGLLLTMMATPFLLRDSCPQ